MGSEPSDTPPTSAGEEGCVTEVTPTRAGTEVPVDVAAEGARIAANMARVVHGKPDVVHLALVVLLAEGHLLPSDVTGVSVYDQETREFEFKPGAIFANIVVADEINRASPKTQSALLECMAERQVTVDGVSYELARPFLVMATQNPIEMEGTYPLPEAQRDRFAARVSMGYPDREAELAMLDDLVTTDPLTTLAPATDAAGVRALVDAVGRLHVSEAVRRYVVALVEATRRSPDLRLGASPRAGLQLLRTARAAAALAGRDHVLPDDVQTVAVPVLAHRLLLTPDAAAARRTAEQLVTDLLRTVPVPRGR
jgi:MoxR-like ATPase